MKTGWGGKFPEALPDNDGGGYLNKDGKGVCHFPGFSVEAAEFLLDERSIVGIGIDTASLDYGMSTDFPVHMKVLGADKYQIENLNLAEVPQGANVTFVCMPLLIENAPESETRVFAVLK